MKKFTALDVAGYISKVHPCNDTIVNRLLYIMQKEKNYNFFDNDFVVWHRDPYVEEIYDRGSYGFTDKQKEFMNEIIEENVNKYPGEFEGIDAEDGTILIKGKLK